MSAKLDALRNLSRVAPVAPQSKAPQRGSHSRISSPVPRLFGSIRVSGVVDHTGGEPGPGPPDRRRQFAKEICDKFMELTEGKDDSVVTDYCVQVFYLLEKLRGPLEAAGDEVDAIAGIGRGSYAGGSASSDSVHAALLAAAVAASAAAAAVNGGGDDEEEERAGSSAKGHRLRWSSEKVPSTAPANPTAGSKAASQSILHPPRASDDNRYLGRHRDQTTNSNRNSINTNNNSIQNTNRNSVQNSHNNSNHTSRKNEYDKVTVPVTVTTPNNNIPSSIPITNPIINPQRQQQQQPQSKKHQPQQQQPQPQPQKHPHPQSQEHPQSGDRLPPGEQSPLLTPQRRPQPPH
jgi:hypothetical protein